MLITMKDVMTANCQIQHAEMLTSNHCAALARELTAMFAAPAPPSGGEVEVLGYRDHVGNLYPTIESVELYGGGRRVRELVDRTHVARLQAVNAALQARLTVADQRVDDLTSERDKLKAQLTDSDHCYRQAHDTGVAVMRQRDGLLAKIETLRSLLSQASGMVNGASSGWHDAVAKELNRENF